MGGVLRVADMGGLGLLCCSRFFVLNAEVCEFTLKVLDLHCRFSVDFRVLIAWWFDFVSLRLLRLCFRVIVGYLVWLWLVFVYIL